MAGERAEIDQMAAERKTSSAKEQEKTKCNALRMLWVVFRSGVFEVRLRKAMAVSGMVR